MINTKPIIKCDRELGFSCTGVADWHVERKSTTMEIDSNMCSSCLPRYIGYVANDKLVSLVITPVQEGLCLRN